MNNLIGANITTIAGTPINLATEAGDTSGRAIASITLDVSADNTANVVLKGPGLQSAGVELAPGSSFQLIRVNLSQMTVERASGGSGNQTMTFLGDTF
ncbi:MAG: hypothetical protein AAGI17_01925 [Planctomycetota bacterium]